MGGNGGGPRGGASRQLALAAPDARHQTATGKVDRFKRCEAGAAQPALHLIVGEAQMDVGMLALQLDQIVRGEIDHEDRAARRYDARGLGPAVTF